MAPSAFVAIYTMFARGEIPNEEEGISTSTTNSLGHEKRNGLQRVLKLDNFKTTITL